MYRCARRIDCFDANGLLSDGPPSDNNPFRLLNCKSSDGGPSDDIATGY